jgi:hypothetical protein
MASYIKVGQSVLRSLKVILPEAHSFISVSPLGAHTEWIYSLMTCGIPHHLIPVTADGKIKLKNHLASIEMRKVAEAYAQNSVIETVELPLASDILLGKGCPF